jgi:type III pantothenate kinase
MMLAVDIGNTHTTVGVFRGRRLVRTVEVETPAWRSGRGPRLKLKADQAIICSVVPWATAKVAKALRVAGIRRIKVVGRAVKVPLKNRYRYPRQVGQDRLVGAYAALMTYKKDCIVCDFGTAITIDIVKTLRVRSRWPRAPSPEPRARGEYLGGVIAPGLGISLDALATRTALLPKVELKKPPELLGRDTANSIRSGVLYGTAALCDGLVLALKRRYAPNATVVATGGSASLIARHARTITHLRPHLVLEGLRLLFLNLSK